MKKCEVLLSTYNGEKYIIEQIKSIAKQEIPKDINVELFIRDDGSSDNTCTLIDQYRKSCPLKITLVKENNIGIRRAFLRLMYISPKADYYFLCDQDDVWNKEKVNETIKSLSLYQDTPALFYSGYEVVDEVLNNIQYVFYDTNSSTQSVIQILYQNRIPGCTMAFNNRLMDIIKKINIDKVRMHDAYVCALAYLYGIVICDNQALILYRQHQNNALGFNKKKKLSKKVKEKIDLLKNGDGYEMSKVALAMLKFDQTNLTRKDAADLEMIANSKAKIIDKINLIFNKGTSSENFASEISVRFKILFNLS